MHSSNKEKEKVQPQAWVMLITVWIASIMAPLAQFKVSPLSSYLVDAYGITLSTFGLLMSWISVIGIILAFPAAFITGKLGPKNSILLCLVFICCGNAIGAVAPTTAVLFFSRVIEGIGLGLMGIAAPSAITPWFPASRRGFPMGLWSAWVPVGVVVSLNVSPRIAAAFGFRAVWWAAFALTLVVTVLFALIYKYPPGITKEDFVVKGTLKEGVRVAKTRNIWVLALAFFSFHIVGTVILNTYYPSFLASTYGMTAVAASGMTSYHTMLCIVTNPLGGLLYEKTQKPKLLICIGLAIILFCACISWSTNINVNIFFIVFSAFGVGLVAGCCRSFSVELLINKSKVMATPVSQAILTFAQRCCDCFAPIVFGALLGLDMGWSITMWFTIPVIAITLLLVIVLMKNWSSSTQTTK